MKKFTHSVSAVICFILLPLISYGLAPEEAAKKVGEEITLEGAAVQVSVTGVGHVYLNFGEKFPKQIFSVYVRKDNVETIGLDFLKSLTGKPIAVKGKVTEHEGRPQIIVKKKEEIIEVT